MNPNRPRDEADRRRNQPESYPDQDTGVPVPDPGQIKPSKLDLRSNAENDWQDEMPADAASRSGRKPQRSSHKGPEPTNEHKSDDEEPNGGFGDGDSARVGSG